MSEIYSHENIEGISITVIIIKKLNVNECPEQNRFRCKKIQVPY